MLVSVDVSQIVNLISFKYDVFLVFFKQLFQDDITFVNVIFCFNSVKSESNMDGPSMTLTFTSKA